MTLNGIVSATVLSCYVIERRGGRPGGSHRRNRNCDRTLMEVVRLDQSRPVREDLTDEELDRWIETFKVNSIDRATLRLLA